MEEKCPIWGTKAMITSYWMFARGDDFASEIDSPRAGGVYKILMDCDEMIFLTESFTEDERIKLTDWLVEQREAGVEMPEIDEGILEDIKTRPEKERSECIKSLMLFLARKYEIFELIESNEKNTRMMLKAYSSSSIDSRVLGYLSDCASEGYLERHTEGIVLFRLTVKGKKYVEDISKIDKQKRQCFVAMWFDKSMDDVYEKAIKPAIEDAGYEAYRVDQDHDNGKIDDQIIAQIRQSRFIIADFTSKPNEPRGGVYYEAGFAHGLGLPVIWTCQSKLIDDLHFDTRQYRHIDWDRNNLQDFYNRIYDSIGANIGWSEGAKDKGTSFSQ